MLTGRSKGICRMQSASLFICSALQIGKLPTPPRSCGNPQEAGRKKIWNTKSLDEQVIYESLVPFFQVFLVTYRNPFMSQHQEVIVEFKRGLTGPSESLRLQIRCCILSETCNFGTKVAH